MMLRLLINDVLHGKLSNLVMCICIALSALLSCASASIMYSSMFQVSYFMEDMGNVAQLNFYMMNVSTQDKQNVAEFLKTHEITEYEIEDTINIPVNTMEINNQSNVSCIGCFASVQPTTYNIVYDEESKIPAIQEGFVGIPLSMKSQLDIAIGDSVSITRGDQVFTYRIQTFTRDPLYGTEMVGRTRLLFHPNDYQLQYDASASLEYSMGLSIYEHEHPEKLEYDMQQAGLPTYALITKDTAQLSFIGMTIGFIAIMMVCGVIVLGMSFLMIRFTILFQIEQKYAEIGIMKAIGLQHKQIKPLYMSKYIGVGLIASFSGYALSIPLAASLKEMQAGIVPSIPSNTGTYVSFIIIPIMLLMIYIITSIVLRKIKKQSAMDAIRSGNEGESYKGISRIQLAKTTRMPLSTFLSINDLLTHMRNTCTLILIYACCLLMVLIPVTLADVFKGGAFLQILNITSGDLYTQQDTGKDMDIVLKEQEQLLSDLQEYDKDVTIRSETMKSAFVSENGLSTSVFLGNRADDNEGVHFDQGKAPLLDDEIALSSTLAKRYDKQVGDSIVLSYDDKESVFLITGLYTSMMNLGNNILGSSAMQDDFVQSNYFVINFSKTKEENIKLAEQIKQDYTKVALIDKNEMMESLSGDMPSQTIVLSNLLTVIFILIVAAITFMFSKLMMIKEREALALMQSFGYARKKIRRWHLQQSIIQALIATMLALLLHYVCTARVLSWFFELMGMGKIDIVYDMKHAFILYPGIFISSIVIAQIIVNLTLQKWNVKDLSEE